MFTPEYLLQSSKKKKIAYGSNFSLFGEVGDILGFIFLVLFQIMRKTEKKKRKKNTGKRKYLQNVSVKINLFVIRRKKD